MVFARKNLMREKYAGNNIQCDSSLTYWYDQIPRALAMTIFGWNLETLESVSLISLRQKICATIMPEDPFANNQHHTTD